MLKPVLGSQIQLGHPLAKGLVGCWLMNEGAGNKVYDLSGNGNGGDFVNTPVWTPGKYGSALDFANGDSDYIVIPHKPVLNITTGCTVIVSFQESISGLHQGLVSKGAHDDAYSILILNSEYLQVRFEGLSTAFLADNTHLLADDTEYVVASVYDGSAIRIYLDGLQIKSTGATGTITTNASDVWIGAMSLPGPRYFKDNIINYAMLYNRGLSASEIARLYREPFAMFGREPIELWVGATSVGAPPVGAAGIMTTNTGYWGPTF